MNCETMRFYAGSWRCRGVKIGSWALQGACQGVDRVVDLFRFQGQPQGGNGLLRGRLVGGAGQQPKG